MAYVKREGGKKYGAGKPRAFDSDSKKSFGKKTNNWADRSDGPVTHFKALCTKCGKTCEVPFRPTNGKPVFCRDCFVRPTEGKFERAGDRYPKKDFHSRSFDKPHAESAPSADVMKQLEIMNTKLERLIRTVEALVSKGE